MDDDIFPFTREQLEKFRDEIEEAGGFENLMSKKKAIIKRGDIEDVATYKNIQSYKRKYLTGVYVPLREMYDTEMPFVFWNDMYEMLQKSEWEK